MRLEERVRASKRGPHPFLRIDLDFWRSQGGLDQNALQQAPVDGPEPLEGAEVGGPEQGGWLGQFHRPAIRQKPSHKLGAEKVVPPLEGQVKIAGERPKHTVMVLLPLGVHGLKLAAEGYVGVLAHPQLIEAAGDRPPAAGDLLLHQSGGEGKVFEAWV